jgi:hypothetical protein
MFSVGVAVWFQHQLKNISEESVPIKRRFFFMARSDKMVKWYIAYWRIGKDCYK